LRYAGETDFNCETNCYVTGAYKEAFAEFYKSLEVNNGFTRVGLFSELQVMTTRSAGGHDFLEVSFVPALQLYGVIAM
jgi:hypothetical protein